MNGLLAAIVGLFAIVLLILLRLHGELEALERNSGRFNFLLVVGVVVMVILLFGFWFAMRTR